MTSDRSWVGRSRYNELKYITEEYKNGVDSFLKFACDNLKFDHPTAVKIINLTTQH